MFKSAASTLTLLLAKVPVILDQARAFSFVVVENYRPSRMATRPSSLSIRVPRLAISA